MIRPLLIVVMAACLCAAISLPAQTAADPLELKPHHAAGVSR